MDFPSVHQENQGLAAQLEGEICEVSAHAHAALAQVAKASAEFDAIGGWCAGGIRSFPHWLAVNAGFDMHTGAELLRVGQALGTLPRIADAFGAGQLSFDKARQITSVATAANEHVLLEISLGASGAQLARICRELRRIEQADAPQRAEALRGIWTHWDENGMLTLVAKLTPEDAAVVQAALDSITGSKRRPSTDDGVDDLADDPWAARRADALVSVCEHVLAGGTPDLTVSPATRQVVVHVDVGVLTGETSDGRCFVEGGSALSAAAARRLGCDAEVVGVVERNGLPIDVGRQQRIVPERLRLALHVRDRFCQFPGCSVPARRTEAHHYEHWAMGGETKLGNLLLLCGFHHRRNHEGAFRISKTIDGYSFEASDGQPIRPATHGPVIAGQHGPPVLCSQHPDIGPETPAALWRGEAMQLSYAVSVIADACEFAEARAAPAS